MPTLHWIGKDKVINHHLDVPFKVLEHSYGFDNGTQTDQEANRLGQLSSIDLRDTQLSLLTARLQHTQLRNNLRLREIELLLLSGGMGYF